MYISVREQSANYKKHSECLVFLRNCCCAASCRVGKMSLSAWSQVAVMCVNEVQPQKPLGELDEKKQCWRVSKYTYTWRGHTDWWI